MKQISYNDGSTNVTRTYQYQGVSVERSEAGTEALYDWRIEPVGGVTYGGGRGYWAPTSARRACLAGGLQSKGAGRQAVSVVARR